MKSTGEQDFKDKMAEKTKDLKKGAMDLKESA